MFRCAMHGLHVAADIDLGVAREAVGEADVMVKSAGRDHWSANPNGDHQVLAEARWPDGAVRHTFWRCAGGYLLTIPRLGRIGIDHDLAAVTYTVDDAYPTELASVLVNGYGMALLLGLRGHLVLHASAVEVDGRAYALVGRSGQGKTTVSALLCRAGARLVTDDVLRVDPDLDGGGWRCWPAATESRLRPNASSIGQGDAAPLVSVDGRTRLQPRRLSGSEPLALASVLFPSPDRERGVVEVQRLPRRAGLLALLSSPRIVGIRDPEWQQRDFAAQSSLTTDVPTSIIRVPWGPPFPESLGEQLLAGLSEAVS